VWGLDLLGPFPRAVGGYQYLYIAINKFTKWPEATPVVKIKKQSTIKFIESIVCRFRVPNRIFTSNGSHFTSRVFQEYCKDLDVQICYTSIAHTERNGQAETTNAEILRGLKTRIYDFLKKHGAKGIEELPCALWANRTTPSQATGETPFFLVYMAEAVIPSPRKSPWSPPVSRYTTKPRRTNSSMMISTSSMSEDGKQLSKMNGTIRCFDAIISGSCKATALGG
jgi:transposase InsO family protein